MRNPPEKIEEFCRMFSVATGLRVDETHRESIERAVERRMAVLDLGTGAEYSELLENPDNLRAEVEAVIPEIMCSDAVFFRSREHFDLLKECLIPEVLQRVGMSRPMRVWDAGCGAGEEAYSTAILMDMYFRRFAPTAYIVGTDINSSAIETAVRGLYGSGSIEGLDERELAYFTATECGHELKQRVKDRVRFTRHNLIDDLPTWKHAGITDIDIVVCRDVLLYFHPEIAQRVIIQFYESVAPGGYLVLGQAEGMLTVHSPFEHCAYKDTIYCRKHLLGHGGEVRLFGIH